MASACIHSVIAFLAPYELITLTRCMQPMNPSSLRACYSSNGKTSVCSNRTGTACVPLFPLRYMPLGWEALPGAERDSEYEEELKLQTGVMWMTLAAHEAQVCVCVCVLSIVCACACACVFECGIGIMSKRSSCQQLKF